MGFLWPVLLEVKKLDNRWKLLCSNRRTCLPDRTETSEKLCFIDVESGRIEQRDFGAFDIPGATTWGKGVIIDGGPEMLMYSHHYKRPIGPDVPFYDTVDVRAWIYDSKDSKLTPIDVYGETDFEYVSGINVIQSERRLIACLFRDLDVTLVSMDFDGANRRNITKPVPGFCHTPSVSPDGSRIASEFQVPGEGGRIFVMDTDGASPVQIEGTPGENQFMAIWSPDGEWISYVEYDHDNDPEHHQAELFVVRPDGSERRRLSEARSFWLSAVNGGPQTYGSGSNYPVWSADGASIVYPRLLPGSQTAWPFKQTLDVDDHFGREFMPGRAVGGTELCRVDIESRKETIIASEEPAVWFFRAAYSPDGQYVAYCRSTLGEPAELWVMDSDGGNKRFLTRGIGDLGVDHPAWIQS